MVENTRLTARAINTIRFLSADAVQTAKSGHPGLPMGAAAMAYTLWTRHLRFNPQNPGWANRDRFILSGGHGSMLLYSLLFLNGYDLSLEDLKCFRQWEQQHTRASGVRRYSRRGSDHRSARAGFCEWGRHGDCRSSSGSVIQPTRSPI